ncbi:hypothetical protein [Phocaeicola plebeius]|jgi:hypothetical protein|uniref:hypothetical protein n=1 Tax=Phocaeicola plebeius TaxID=310297 RepID=UPI00307FB130
MNKKLLEKLQDKCKDFGLSEKAIEDLAELGSDGLTDETSDEDIEKKADSLVPTAKLLQAEVTRKAQKRTTTPPKTVENSDEEPDWFKNYKEQQEKQMQELRNENAAMKAEKSKAERGAAIAAKAKELGIPDLMMKHFSIADDADIEKVLTEYKQDLITSKLMPAEKADILSSSEQAVKDDAKAWANALPNV